MNKTQINLRSRYSKIKRINHFEPNIGEREAAIVRQAAEIINRGGIVVFPTSGLYGLAADAFNMKAIERIFSIKRRSPRKPILVLIRSVEALSQLVETVPDIAKPIISKIWPGQVTVVLKAKKNIPEPLTAGKGKIGVRVPENPTAFKLAQAAGIPITGTSANISGQPGCACIDDLDPTIIEQVDMIIDTGRLKGGVGSTVIDLSENIPKILREGMVKEYELLELMGKV